ncbi:hypothetical protein [Alienimonas californiensis]|uniref:SLA1 homology domain-containing protein n=1 Tax=Alienimonas californiensis TaxID=2527989 RepID=A0A517PFC1_9PLAN|nr:hypothetical protein [Alienimonas californiensis]QDT18059.1 hypothetical protein CA12_41980 [Alienimonas californiensis]
MFPIVRLPTPVASPATWGVAAWLLCLTGPLASSAAFAQERAVLTDAPSGTHAVTLTVAAKGTITPRHGADPLPAEVRATYRFHTRPLPVEGEGPTGRRSVRYYDAAGSELTVGPQPTYARLRGSRRMVVATGMPVGTSVLSPGGPLRYGELELLGTPLDPLLVGGLLPTGSVSEGDDWEPADWVGPALAGVEAVGENQLRCKLTALTDAEARGTFRGKIAGATDGASLTVTFDGTFAYDRAAKAITAATLNQTVEGSPGPISPGVNLAFKASLTRTPEPDAGPLDAAALRTAADAVRTPEQIEAAERVELVTPWGTRAELDRDWRFVNQSAKAAVVVRMDRGAPAIVATLTPLDDAEEGAEPDAAAFERRVRLTLEKAPGTIETTASLDLPNAEDAGRALLLVRVSGKDAAGDPQNRDHYLLADGPKRAEIVFAYPPNREAEVGELAFPLLDAVRWR